MMVFENCRDHRSHHGPAMPDLPKHLRVVTGTVACARSIGPCQLAEIIREFGGGGPEFDGGSRKLLNTINDMDLEGPCPFILPSSGRVATPSQRAHSTFRVRRSSRNCSRISSGRTVRETATDDGRLVDIWRTNGNGWNVTDKPSEDFAKLAASALAQRCTNQSSNE